MTITNILQAINQKKTSHPESTPPYPIIGVLEDGEIIENAETGGTYKGTGLTWDFAKPLQEQSEAVQEYFKGFNLQ